MAMNKALFEELLESLKQTDQIARGSRKPSRMFEVQGRMVKQLRGKAKLGQIFASRPKTP